MQSLSLPSLIQILCCSPSSFLCVSPSLGSLSIIPLHWAFGTTMCTLFLELQRIKKMVGQFSYFVDILLCYTYIFRRQVLWGKDTRSERLLIVAKVKPASLLTVPSGILFPKSVSYNFDLSLFFPHRCFLSTTHVPGSEERVLVFNEPAIQRDTKRCIDIYKASMREAIQEAEKRCDLCKDCLVIIKVLT